MAYDEQNVYRSQSGAGVDAHAIDEGLRTYMLRVYNYMALGIAWTAVVTLLMVQNKAVMSAIALGPMKWVLFIALIGMGFFAHKIILSGSTVAAQLCFWVYASLWGVLISPMIYAFLAADKAALIFQAFAITSVTFGSLSLFGYVTKKDLAPLGSFLFMASIGLILVMLVGVIGGFGSMFSLIVSFGVVLLFAVVTAYETQMIKESYYAGDSSKAATGKAIFGAFLLYGSFITLFIHILNILGIMSGDD